MKVLVVTSGWPTDNHPERSIFVAEQVAKLREAGVEIDVVTYQGRSNPMNYLRARREVKLRLRSDRFDLIHAHFGQSGLAVFPSPLPTVFTFHGSDLIGVIGRRGSYTMRGRFLLRVSRWAARRADHVIVVASAIAQHLPDGVESEVLPMGANTDVFFPRSKDEARAALGLEPNGTYVLFSGDPAVVLKRFDLAQDAVAILNSRSSHDVRLLAIAHQSREVVAQYMNASDALLVTAKHEGSPVIVKEAIACGTPIVSVDVGTVRELIGALPGCVVCPDDEAATIAGCLQTALEQHERFDAPTAIATVDQRALAARQVEIYKRVIGRPRSAQKSG